MRNFILTASLILISCYGVISQDTIICTSKINNVTVYLKGAQIHRTGKCHLKKGINTIKFSGITSKTEEHSVQVKTNELVKLQSVNFSVNHLDSLKKKKVTLQLNNELDSLLNEKELLETKLFILTQEKELLEQNKVLSGQQKIITSKELKEASQFYREQFTDILKRSLKIRSQINSITKREAKIKNQLTELNDKKEMPVGEIWVLAYAEEEGQKEFSIEYHVKDAGWIPKYDLRANEINKPAFLSYKAEIFQNTDDDWSNVKLLLSSSNPSLGGTKPELNPWKLNLKDFYSASSDLQNNSNHQNSVEYYDNLKKQGSIQETANGERIISGTIVGADDGQPLPGVNIVVKGTTCGTITDLDGNYSITVPEGAKDIVFSYVGYSTTERTINSGNLNIALDVDTEGLEEVVVVGYGTVKKATLTGASTSLRNDGYGNFTTSGSGLSGRLAGVSPGKPLFNRVKKKKKEKVNKKIMGLNSIKENQTSFEFSLDKPYTIPSDNNNYSVDIEQFEIPVNFQYSTAPKLEESAFLLAEITGWEDLNLLPGKANIYFEGSFVGSSEIDVNQTNDTLNISMGRDQAIVIDRKLKKDYSKKQLLSKWKTESYTWEIVVKNTKNQKININVEDQIPVSINKNLVVELLESSNAELDKDKGELKWKLELGPLEKKVLNLSYLVQTRI